MDPFGESDCRIPLVDHVDRSLWRIYAAGPRLEPLWGISVVDFSDKSRWWISLFDRTRGSR